jgi:hypothetical protein
MKTLSASSMSVLIAFVCAISTGESLAQNSRIDWSAISSGFGVPGSSASVLKSSAGQVVGSSQLTNSRIGSGFLAFDASNWLSCNVSVRIFLEGAYNTGTQQMNKTLWTGGFLASHFGSTPIPVEAVDSISIELRNAASASASTIRKFRPAWLLTDGSIRDFFDTTANYVTFDTLAGNYYLVISHRNHIAVMTAASQALNGAISSSSYNFTTAQSQAFGSNPMKAVAGGKFAMIAGDANTNGQVATSDINSIIRPRLGQSGYHNADINLNGQIQTSDINTYARPNLGKGTQVPASPTQGGIAKEEAR